jgi:hypothetical protein
VWLDPILRDTHFNGQSLSIVIIDPPKRSDVTLPMGIPPAAKRIATVRSRGFERWVDEIQLPQSSSPKLCSPCDTKVRTASSPAATPTS